MSFATDALTIAQEAYKDALSGKRKKLNGRELEQHDIDALYDNVIKLENRVAKETSSAAGHTSGSIRMHS